MTTSLRERYCAALAYAPPTRGDAIIVLCGEDAEPRADVAVELFRLGAAPVILATGGIDQPPRWHGAGRVMGHLLGAGIAPDRIRADTTAQHTRDQASVAIEMAIAESWTRLLVVASPYHVPRAHLTFLQALRDRDRAEQMHVVMVGANQTSHFLCPAGMSECRLDLLGTEYDKIDAYHAKGHVASYDDGLAYLHHWSGR